MFIKFRSILFCLTLSIALFFSVSAHAEQKHITFSTFAFPYNSVIGKICELTLTEAFHRLGMTFSVVILPVKRAAIQINDGNIDGDLGRARNYADNYPNIMRLEESFINAKLVAFAKKPNIKVKSAKDFLNSNLKVSYPLGSTLIEKELKNVLAANNLTTTLDRMSALKMLIKGRNDVYIDGELDMIKLLRDPQFTGSKIYNSGTILDVPIYAFLNKKHKDILPKLIKILRDMKSEGLIKKYTKIALHM